MRGEESYHRYGYILGEGPSKFKRDVKSPRTDAGIHLKIYQRIHNIDWLENIRPTIRLNDANPLSYSARSSPLRSSSHYNGI